MTTTSEVVSDVVRTIVARLKLRELPVRPEAVAHGLRATILTAARHTHAERFSCRNFTIYVPAHASQEMQDRTIARACVRWLISMAGYDATSELLIARVTSAVFGLRSLMPLAGSPTPRVRVRRSATAS
jgi:hypothetical protein